MQINDLFVLVVEPSKMQRRVIMEALEEAGISSLMEAETGAQALEIMRADPPDLMVSAFHLEDMSGADLLTTIRTDDFFKDTGFILVSSETKMSYLDPVKQAGATALLPKPFTKEQLHTALRTTVTILEPEYDEALSEFDTESLHVLVVDDSPLSRKHIRKVLTALGVQLFSEAEDGEQAIEKLSTEYFDLVVTDYNMPNLNGKELTEFIRQRSGQRSIPVLMVTSETNEGRLAGVQQAGVSAVCDKPFATDEVRKLLFNLLSDS